MTKLKNPTLNMVSLKVECIQVSHHADDIIYLHPTMENICLYSELMPHMQSNVHSPTTDLSVPEENTTGTTEDEDIN